MVSVIFSDILGLGYSVLNSEHTSLKYNFTFYLLPLDEYKEPRAGVMSGKYEPVIIGIVVVLCINNNVCR